MKTLDDETFPYSGIFLNDLAACTLCLSQASIVIGLHIIQKGTAHLTLIAGLFPDDRRTPGNGQLRHAKIDQKAAPYLIVDGSLRQASEHVSGAYGRFHRFDTVGLEDDALRTQMLQRLHREGPALARRGSLQGPRFAEQFCQRRAGLSRKRIVGRAKHRQRVVDPGAMLDIGSVIWTSDESDVQGHAVHLVDDFCRRTYEKVDGDSGMKCGKSSADFRYRGVSQRRGSPETQPLGHLIVRRHSLEFFRLT